MNSKGVYKDVKRKGRQGLERGLGLEREKELYKETMGKCFNEEEGIWGCVENM
jgi:hypothetical protein